MTHRKIIYTFLAILFCLSFVLGAIIIYPARAPLKVIFFDIGQGDAALISQGKNQILIDGGPSAQKELEKLGKYIPFWDRKIEVVVATHPDQDHIEGLLSAIKNYEIGEVIDNGVASESQVYKNYRTEIEGRNISTIKGEKGLKIKMNEAELNILYPEFFKEEFLKDTNAGSLVSKLSYGENSFLLTGDIPMEEEKFLFESHPDLSARILKVSHHGSKYATSQEFLDKVKAQEAVISVGEKNRYGHPSPEVLLRLQEKGINIMRTDKIGDIVYNCPKKDEKCFLEYN